MRNIENIQSTVGIDFLVKNIVYKDRGFRLQLWDTAGQERFRSLIPSYLKDAVCCIVVFDVSRKETLANAAAWLKLYK
jgi:GTPase SAR1 family protein